MSITIIPIQKCYFKCKKIIALKVFSIFSLWSKSLISDFSATCTISSTSGTSVDFEDWWNRMSLFHCILKYFLQLYLSFHTVLNNKPQIHHLMVSFVSQHCSTACIPQECRHLLNKFLYIEGWKCKNYNNSYTHILTKTYTRSGSFYRNWWLAWPIS